MERTSTVVTSFAEVREGDTVHAVVDAIARSLPPDSDLCLLTYRPAPSRPVRVSPQSVEERISDALHHAGFKLVPGRTPAASWRSVLEHPRGEGEVLGLDSRVWIPGSTPLRLPLLDFSVPASPSALTAVRMAARALAPGPGLVLASGNSYHWYGSTLLSPRAWRRLMARALLLDELVDARWVGHCLLEETASLRLTVGGGKPVLPTVAATL